MNPHAGFPSISVHSIADLETTGHPEVVRLTGSGLLKAYYGEVLPRISDSSSAVRVNFGKNVARFTPSQNPVCPDSDLPRISEPSTRSSNFRNKNAVRSDPHELVNAVNFGKNVARFNPSVLLKANPTHNPVRPEQDLPRIAESSTRSSDVEHMNLVHHNPLRVKSASSKSGNSDYNLPWILNPSRSPSYDNTNVPNFNDQNNVHSPSMGYPDMASTCILEQSSRSPSSKRKNVDRSNSSELLNAISSSNLGHANVVLPQFADDSSSPSCGRVDILYLNDLEEVRPTSPEDVDQAPTRVQMAHPLTRSPNFKRKNEDSFDPSDLLNAIPSPNLHYSDVVTPWIADLSHSPSYGRTEEPDFYDLNMVNSPLSKDPDMYPAGIALPLCSPSSEQSYPTGINPSDPLKPVRSPNPGYSDAVIPRIVDTPILTHTYDRPESYRLFAYGPANECSPTDAVADHVHHSVIFDVLSEATEEDASSLYSFSSCSESMYSFSNSSSRAGSGRRREEQKRQRYWNYTEPGITVDELARHRRKRPPSSQRPKDSLKVLDGSFAHLKTEYKRRFRRNSLLKSIDKLKPEDLLRLEGELKCNAEYNEEFVQHPLHREKLLRRPTSLKLEGSLESATESQEKFKYEEAERSPLVKPEGSLKTEGENLVKVSEVHEKFVEFPGAKRPELQRKATTLKLEGAVESSTEIGENFVSHPPQPLEKPIIHGDELSSANSPMAHEVTTEYRPEYKENYIAFGVNRNVARKPEGNLKPEGEMKGSSELKSEYKDFHPSRPVLHRNNSMLKPSGGFGGDSEKQSEFKDFHPARPTLHRNNSLLRPSGEFESSTEKGSEYKDFHAGRPVLQRNNSQLKPSGDMAKTSEVRAEYKNFSPKRPVIHRVDSKLKPEGDMAKMTEVKSEYRDFHPSRPVIHRTPSNLAMEGRMEKDTEIRAEYRDFHPSRPVIYRKNSMLKPEGDIEANPESNEYRDFHPSRPTIHRNNSLLHPEGETGKGTEARSEYRDFHPGRPVIHRNNSLLHPEGETGKGTEAGSEYRDFHPGRPVIHRKNSMLHPEGEVGKDTEARSEYRDFHPGRPVIHRKNSMLHPEGDVGKDTEAGTEYRDFQPGRPVIHRNNSMLHPEGETGKDTEVRSEYKDFHPGRPVIHRNNSMLRPEGDMMNTDSELKAEYRDHKPKRPTIYTENCNLKPGNRIEERTRALTPKKGDYYVLEGEITLRPDRSAKALENIKNEERSSTAGRRLPGTSTLPRSRAARSLLPDGDAGSDRTGFRFTVENVDDASRDKAFVVLNDDVNNNNSSSLEDLPEFQNRWLRGSVRDRAEPWRPSWTLNPNTKDVPKS